MLKITTAQTMAIDSLERKIALLSKRKQEDMNHDMVVPKQDEKIRKLLQGGIQAAMQNVVDRGNVEEKKEEPQKKLDDIFTDIKEDNFESSEDEEERLRTERLDRLGKIANLN